MLDINVVKKQFDKNHDIQYDCAIYDILLNKNGGKIFTFGAIKIYYSFLDE